MSKILIISLSNLKQDARVKRQIYFLKDKYQLTVACFDALEDSTFKFVKLNHPNLTLSIKILAAILLVLRFFSQAFKLLHSYPELRSLKYDFDLIIANDIESLPLAYKLKGKAKLLFDAHEYFPRQFEDKFAWRILFQPFNKYLCSKYLSKADIITTIGEGIAKEYEKQYLVKPIVINNAAPFQNIAPSTTSEGIIQMIHHGIAIPSRRLELMIAMMDHLDERFHLNLMVFTPQTGNQKTRKYLFWLKEISKNNKRIKFIEPVKSEEVVETINKFDIGIILVPPINFNYKNGLGNKFFDFIQARLAIAIGPIPEMAAFVEQYNLGLVSEDFTARALAEILSSLTSKEINSFKENAEIAAREINAEKNKILLNKIVKQLLST